MVQTTIQPTSTISSRTFIFVTCLLFRLLNAYYTRTYDNPDEYWQGHEVAHELVFGNGYLTWEWREKIRSFLHPITIALAYKVVQLLGLQNTHVLVAAPRYFQATLAAVADVATYTLAKKVIGNDIALSMLFTTLCSWFNFQMAARTLSNSMEMVFTIIALNYWPLPGIVKTTGKSWAYKWIDLAISGGPFTAMFKQRIYTWVVVIYSLLPHKEFRFIFPIVPLMLMIAAYGIQQTGSPRWRKRIMLFLVFTQLPMALYTSIWHQRGVVDVMLWMRSQPRNISVGVLMPCHSTPWYSIIHDNIPMWFLTCEPPLGESNELDEADQFYANPTEFLKTHQKDRLWPTTHLLLFDNLIPKIREYLDKEGYKECQRFFNSHFHDDERRRGDVVLVKQR
ncbi:hypothetical protein [Parasitella parasitica]|uniref:Mannosyltransferase n=1 Tax=Parasitella parasitica TaxID=35722 RepID=A0A0B7NAD4_9FUNG|nr:hypothetical protein [Parasitella parasitica]